MCLQKTTSETKCEAIAHLPAFIGTILHTGHSFGITVREMFVSWTYSVKTFCKVNKTLRYFLKIVIFHPVK